MSAYAFPGLSVERLAELATEHGVTGSPDGLLAFSRAVRDAALHAGGQPVLITLLRPNPSGTGHPPAVVTES